jgi:hypothetical protein
MLAFSLISRLIRSWKFSASVEAPEPEDGGVVKAAASAAAAAFA